jgi:hypothetical protein
MRGRQVLDPGDPLGHVRHIVAWPIHNRLLLTNPRQEDGLHATA